MMDAQKMLDKFRNDGSCEESILEIMRDAERLKVNKRMTVRALMQLQKHYIDIKGYQGTEEEFHLLRAAMNRLCAGDEQIIPMTPKTVDAGGEG